MLSRIVAFTTLALIAHADLEQLAKESLAQIDGRVALAGIRDTVEVVRDRWGVPHIYARNIDDLFFAQGYVQAQDRLWQMEMHRRTFEGSLSEILGPAYLRHDRLVRLLRYRGPFDEREWTHYHPEGRRNFEMGIVTDDTRMLDAAQARFDRIWRGAECGACKLRRECPAPISLGTTKPACRSPAAPRSRSSRGRSS